VESSANQNNPTEKKTLVTPTEAQLDQLADLYGASKYQEAWQLSQEIGPLPAWQGARARVLAGRLANNLGGLKMGRVLHRLAYREFPHDPEVIYFAMLAMFSQRGPYETWMKLKEIGELSGASDQIRADWYALHARVLAHLRDVGMAEQWMEHALELAPERSWLWVQQSALRELQDQQEEALATARKAFELRPWYRPAVQAMTHCLVQAGQDEEALAVLTEAASKLESGDIWGQLASLQYELQMYEDSRQSFAKAEQFYPLLHTDKQRFDAVRGRRSDTEYRCGNIDTAAKLLEGNKISIYESLHKRLSIPDAKSQVKELVVPYVRQQHMIYVPAALAAVCRYWNREVTESELSESIKQSVGVAHSERRWTQQNGFIAREFTLTWDAAQSLIDRDIPFLLTTVESGGAQLQVVLGYDTLRQTLFTRDPNERHRSEMDTAKLIEKRDEGVARGLVLVPEDQAEKLAGIELQDDWFYDKLFELEEKLEAHQVEEAQAVVTEMLAADPQHRLSLQAQGSLESYHVDVPGILATTEKLLSRFPDNVNYLVNKLNCLRELGRRQDRIDLLEELCDKPDPDPLFWQQLAHEYVDDHLHADRAEYLLRRTMRRRPMDGRSYGLLADLYWNQDRREESLALYRFGASLDDRDESRAKAYFFPSKFCGEGEVALKFLRDRYQRQAKQSTLPLRTLCWAYEQMEQHDKSFQLLDYGLSENPDDDELILFAADSYSRYGKHKRANELLQLAKPMSHKTGWLRTAAYLAMYQGDLQQALSCWQQVVQAEPLARDAHEMVASLLADLQNDEAAIAHISAAVKEFPHNYSLRALELEWLRRSPPEDLETAARSFLESFPSDAYAMRELAIVLVKQSKWEEAMREAEKADKAEPSSPVSAYIRGRIFAATQHPDKAKAAFREAIVRSVDYEQAIGSLMEVCESRTEREVELNFVYEQLKTQPIMGDGLLTFRETAASVFKPEPLLRILQEALDSRPDLWHAWAAVVRQLCEMDRVSNALPVARAACERFPLLPRVWLDLAHVHQTAGDVEGEISSLRQALEINSNWGDAARQLAEAYQRQGRMDKAKKTLERIIVVEPRNVLNHGMLGEVLWNMNQRQEAMEAVRHAVTLEPGYDWAWSRLRYWGEEMGTPTAALELATELTEKRPKEARSWLILAENLVEPSQAEEQLVALDKALALNPTNVLGLDQKAATLANLGRVEEALEVCKAPNLNPLPVELRAREADIMSQTGDLDSAIRRMREVANRDPDHHLPWMKLAEWYMATDNNPGYLEAAKNLVRIAPSVPMSWLYCGHAEMKSGNRDAAKRNFEKALDMDPEHPFAAKCLIDLYLEDRDLTGAAHAIERAQRALPPEHIASQHVRLAAASGDLGVSLRRLQQVAAAVTEDPDPLRWAVGALLENNWGPQAFEAILEVAASPNAPPLITPTMVDLALEVGRMPDLQEQLPNFEKNDQFWPVFLDYYLDTLANVGDAEQVKSLVAGNSKLLNVNNDVWIAAINALDETGDRGQAKSLIAAWPERSNLLQRHYFELQYRLRRMEMEDQARVACAKGLDLGLDDRFAHLLLIFAAADCLTLEDRPDVNEAIRLLNLVNTEALNDYYYELLMLVDRLRTALVALATSPRDAGEIVEAAAAAVPEPLQKEPTFAGLVERVKWQVQKGQGGLGGLFARFRKPK
jgi:tetratricopeptide (TPR) repeat protein